MKAKEPAPSSEKPSFVVGIGASAGGLESVSNLLKNLAPDTGMSFVVIQHLDPKTVSQMPAILSRTTKMPVCAITHTLAMEPNCVYVLPPGHDVLLENNIFNMKLREKRAAMDGQIDKFLVSLADQGRKRAIGIVLSGTGSDGTAGLKEIKQKGGLTFVEAESTAKFFGMPGSAINAGVVDQVFTPPDLAHHLGLLGHRGKNALKLEANKKPEPPPSALEKIFALLHHHKQVDFTHYKHNTIRRRLDRRMALLEVSDMENYAERLANNPQEISNLFKDLLINVTGFFRDKAVFQSLVKHVLPKLIAEKNEGDDLRIWIPGCATGEEVYTIGICVAEALAKAKVRLKAQIFATDLSEWALRRARAGNYPAALMKDVSPERLTRHFTLADGHYQISRTIRDLCTFAQQNLCTDPPFSRLDLISCRNVLIYFGTKLQHKCIPLFYYALNDHGCLLLGNSETIGSFPNLFTLMDKKNKIYRKKTSPLIARQPEITAASLVRKSLPPPPPPPATKKPPGIVLPSGGGLADVPATADHLILTHFAPCGVVVDPQFQVWHFRGNTAPFLQHSPGVASLNLLKMVHEDLVPDLSAAIHQSLKSGNGVRKEGLLMKTKAGTRDVQLEVIPFNVPSSEQQWLLVIFEGRLPAMGAVLHGKDRRSHSEEGYAREVARLRSELKSTKDSLQSIIEEHEAANEEIKSANEEIESSNEELQSTNEELETAKEELQATNEELSTVNDELTNRNNDISEINSDLQNILSSIHVAVVLVDNGLLIRRTTPLAEKLFNILPADIGRKLSDINPNLVIPGMTGLIRTVIDNLVPIEQEIMGHDGQAYSLRIRPHRTRENVINGAVIVLVDVAKPNS